MVLIEAAQQCDEQDAAVTQLHLGDDLAGVPIQRRDDRQAAVTNVLVVATDAGVLARYRGQVSAGGAQCLHARLLVHADGIDRLRSAVMNRICAVQVHVAADHQHLGHLALELSASPRSLSLRQAKLTTQTLAASAICGAIAR